MNAVTPVTKLLVRKGQQIEAGHHNGLVKLAEAITLQRGPVKGRQTPDGFTPRVNIVQNTAVNHAFKVFIDDLGNKKAAATFWPGHVSGVVPKIGSVFIDDLTEQGEPPTLQITPASWAHRGNVDRCLIMFRYELDPGFNVTAVVPVAVPSPPAPADFTWHKLIAFLTRTLSGDIRICQQCFFSQYFNAVNPHGGRFTAISRIAS